MARITTGIINTLRAIAPPNPMRTPGPKITTNAAYANSPATIEGIPVITSTKNVTALAKAPRPYSTK